MNEPTRSLRAEIVALPATRSKPAAAQMVPQILSLSQEKQRSGRWNGALQLSDTCNCSPVEAELKRRASVGKDE